MTCVWSECLLTLLSCGLLEQGLCPRAQLELSRRTDWERPRKWLYWKAVQDSLLDFSIKEGGVVPGQKGSFVLCRPV